MYAIVYYTWGRERGREKVESRRGGEWACWAARRGGNSAAGSDIIHSAGRWGGGEADWMGGGSGSHAVDR